MTRLAVTGHQGLPELTVTLVDRALRDLVLSYGDLLGLSCLAEGPDQLFAASTSSSRR